MIRRHVLAAVDAGVVAGDEDAARAALGRIDWVLRGQARRRLEGALIEAALATRVLAADAPATARHVLRAAGLIVRGHREIDLADPDQVARRYEATEVTAPVRLPIASLVAGLVALVAATAVAAAAVFVVTDERGPYTPPPPPPPIGAYRDGGAPIRDLAIEQALAIDLTGLVVANDGTSGRPEVDRTELVREVRRRARALRAHPVFAAHGGRLARTWRAMIDSLERWVPLAASDATYHAATSDLIARVHAVSDQLAGVGLAYFLDPEVFTEHGRRHAGILAYRVESVGFVRAARDRVRVLSLRRLDRLNVSRALLGMTPQAQHDPIVLLDQIEEHVRTQVLPVLAGRPYRVADDGWADSTAGRAVSAAAGDAIRRELRIALGPDLGSDLGPDLAAAALAGRCDQLVTASVRHHEAQHGLDQRSHRRYPRALAGYAGPLRGDDGHASALAARARTELSAYLSQIASDLWLPQLALWNLSRHAFRRGQGLSAESYAAVVVIEGLARTLRVPSAGPAFHDGAIDRDRLSALVAPLAARSTIELRSAAAALWGELFGDKLARIVDD
ncbi:MAG TPA: hypothetical protein VFK02_05845 [Kofleriaceae bacterium]|nr:hypothetical protein [Kofleriaceae bacterium]